MRDWPTGDAFEALLRTLDAAIEGAREPEERTRLEKLRESAVEVGQGLLTGILTNVVTQVAGLR